MRIFTKIYKSCITLLFCLITCFAETQGQENEYYLWTGVKISKEIIKDLRLVINPEFRTISEFDRKELLMETGLGYKPFKFLGLDLIYRFSREYTPDETFTRHRFAFDIQPKTELGRFSAGLRLRYTNFSEGGFDMSTGEKYLRYRVETEYNIKGSKLTPYCSMEFFHNLAGREINKLRYLIGANFKFNKVHSIDNFFIFQDYPGKLKNRYIFGVSYKIRLKNSLWQKRV